LTDRYLKKVQDALAASRIVLQPILSVDDRGEVWFLRADVYFIDNSLLHFRELWIGQGRRQKKTYTYHYQRSDGALVFRYDNAPHYPDLPSAPHHKHIGENDILAAETPDLFQVLKEIEDIIGSSAE
jgi:hypothetical protein